MKLCDCCEGIEQLPPLSLANRPGLTALVYRIGTHATFLETMKARLSTLYLDSEERCLQGKGLRPLKNLTARDGDDPAITWLDGWATVADVLTFYQERIANEGYLRTATERRSILELARLVGYQLRPGVAATVYLAFTMDNGYTITIPAGSRAQSIPGPGELPQSFETADPLSARDVWNNLKPRLTRPQAIQGSESDLYLAGINTNLKPNDPILLVFDNTATPPLTLRQVKQVMVQAAADRTLVTLQPSPESQQAIALIAEINRIIAGLWEGPRSEMADRVHRTLAQFQTEMGLVSTLVGLAEAFDKALPAIREEYKAAIDNQYARLAPWVGDVATALENLAEASGIYGRRARQTAAATARATNGRENGTAVSHLANYLTALAKPPSLQPANSLKLGRDLKETYTPDSDIAVKLLRTLRPALASVLYQSWRDLPLTDLTTLNLYTLRIRASVFGHNAPLQPITDREGIILGHREWSLQRVAASGIESFVILETFEFIIPDGSEEGSWWMHTTITLDGEGSGTDSRLLEEGEFDIQFDENETITVQVSGLLNDPLLIFVFDFQTRPIQITITMDVDGFKVSSASRDMTEVNITSTREGGVFTHLQQGVPQIQVEGEIAPIEPAEIANILWLDAPYGQIVPGSWVVVERPYGLSDTSAGSENIPQTVITQVESVSEGSRAEYGITGKSTRLVLRQAWIDPERDTFRVIRETAVFAQSDLLTLTEAPIDPVEGAVCCNEIELEGLYDGLEAGRWLIITGERTDITPDEDTEGLSGVTAVELVMLAGVEQIFDETLPGEKAHTKLLLAEKLAYCYKLDTVTIYGNVAKASHGETRQEVLGSGDSSQSFQRFTLKQSPLTYVSDPNPRGIQSSLTVRVNDIKWHEADNLTELGPNDREFMTQTDTSDKTTVIFGDGRYGARLPTGIENVKAIYRNGIGKVGNVSAGQISVLATRPLGVKGVINPLRASGGANRDNLDQARHNAPLAVMALDRLVSTQDYADFARTFAGIGKASAVELTDGRREVVHLTIAGVDDIPIDKSSDLYRNLRQALHQFGDPYQPIQVDMRRHQLLIIGATVRILPDYLWEAVAPQIRANLLDTFSFDRRELGQDVVLSEVIHTIQAVPGVAYVDVDVLDAVDETADIDTLTQLANTLTLRKRIEAKMAWIDDRATDPDDDIQPAQLVYLSPDVPDTLILTELT